MMPTNSPDDLLQFKDYSNSPATSSPPQINVNSPSHSTNSATSGRIRGDPLSELIYDMSNVANSGNMKSGTTGETGGEDPNTGGTGKVSFLSIEYYQQFFNVDTQMVVERIVNSMIPKRAGGSYLRTTIGENPDFYGPFWITTTLIFSIAISGNIASYLAHANDAYHWRYNFHLVSYAATCIFIYANFVPAALWAVFKYTLKPVQEGLETENADYTPSLLSLMCIYGYSLAIYIPVSILWAIPFSVLQWILVISGALLSGSVLIAVLTPALRNSRFSLFLIIGILGAHFLLAAGFMLFFFHVPSDNTTVPEKLQHIESVTKAASNIVKTVLNNTVDRDIKNI